MNLDYKKVLVGLSGGVDSSVCVDLLRKQGLEVTGLFIKFSRESESALEDAKQVRRQLNVKLETADARQLFKEKVTQPFCRSYMDGKTPNPCVICNPLVKFATLTDRADRLGIGYIATGHYALIEKTEQGYFVKKGVSHNKDQSYMLYRLGQQVLSRLILPIGIHEKDSIRQNARELELITAQKPDSQDICFIPGGDYIGYIESQGFSSKDGYFVSPEGKRLKKHGGIHKYTIGQRRGVGIALGKPVFVKEIKDNGDIVLGYSGEEFFTKVSVIDPVYSAAGIFQPGQEYDVKVRSGAKVQKAKILSADENGIEAEFLQPVRAAAPGQSMVFYKDDLVMGGGFIEKSY